MFEEYNEKSCSVFEKTYYKPIEAQARTLVVAIKDHGANIIISDLNERLARLEKTVN